jgi:CRISPR system Cascade subunit CasA
VWRHKTQAHANQQSLATETIDVGVVAFHSAAEFMRRASIIQCRGKQAMNLVTDPWIPVRRLTGAHRLIRPLDLSDTNDPPMELAAIRPDFNGALAQFLIGLLQLIAPDRQLRLEGMQANPETFPVAKLAELAKHFEFDSGPARVMQDTDFDASEALELPALLIEAPGENTVKNNADLFAKRRESLALSLPLAAQALITMQTNAPSGGQGHRTSLRGGGPISMLLWPRELNKVPTTLLQKLLLNVFAHSNIEDEPRVDITLPWCAPCLTSEGGADVLSKLAKQKPTTDEQRLLCYFATARRVRLRFESEGHCDWSGEKGAIATRYETKNFGANYLSQSFQHPLSPYYEMKGDYLPLHLNELGFTYADWVQTIGGEGIKAPAVLDKHRLGALSNQLGHDAIWAFGFLMDNMKCLAWHEARFPVFNVPDQRKNDVLSFAMQMVDGTEAARKLLARAIRKAWTDEGKNGDTSVAERELYANTERAFYYELKELAQPAASEAETTQRIIEQRDGWYRTLYQQAMRLFETHAERSDVRDDSVQTIERAANAHASLSKGLWIEVRTALGLEVKAKTKKPQKEAA